MVQSTSRCCGAAVWFVLLISAETATARTRLSHVPPIVGSPDISLGSVSNNCDKESALWLSLASFSTSGAAYASPQQQHPQLAGNPSPSQELAAAEVRSAKRKNSGLAFHLPNSPHKPLLPNVDQWDVLLLLCTAITLFLAAGGGIGGGAVFVVLYVFVGGELCTSAAGVQR